MGSIPTDDEIWSLVNAMVNRAPQIASSIADYFGAEFHPKKGLKISKKSKQSLVRKISRMARIQAEISLIKKEELVKPAARRHLRKRFNELLRLFDEGSIPAGEDALRWQKWTFWWMTMPSEEYAFVPSTRFKNYHRTLLTLAESLYYSGKRIHTESFLTDFESSSDARAIVQAFFGRRLERKFKSIQKFAGLDRKSIVNVVELYHNLAGVFEKYVSVLVGLLEIDKNGVFVPFADVKRRQLHTNLTILRGDDRFKDILSAFDKTIRNSLAHETWSVVPSKGLIIFVDLGKHVEVKFKEFSKKTRELAAAVLALTNIRVFLLYVQFDYFDRIFSGRAKQSLWSGRGASQLNSKKT